MAIFAHFDPVVARVVGWADEDPAVMRRLLEDAELRAQLLRALDDLAPGTEASSRRQKSS